MGSRGRCCFALPQLLSLKGLFSKFGFSLFLHEGLDDLIRKQVRLDIAFRKCYTVILGNFLVRIIVPINERNHLGVWKYGV